jgi:hypothetical protein
LDDSTGQTARDLGPNHLALTLGTSAGIDNNDPTWISLAGSLASTVTSLDFGNIIKDSTVHRQLVVTNPSHADIQIDSMYNKFPIFTFLPKGFPFLLKSGDSINVNLQFHPDSLKLFRDTLFIHNSSIVSLIKIALSGNSPTPSISITPPSISFGIVRKDSTSNQIFKITNGSINVLQVDSLWIKSKYFTVGKTLSNKILRTADTVQISISFTPDTSRNFFDTLFIANNSSLSPMKVPLSGNGTVTGVTQLGNEIPKAYALYQNYPNPFNPSTNIQYGLPVQSTVRLVVYNILGQVVKELVNTGQLAGYQSVVWNANVSSGLFFYRLEASSKDDPSKRFVETKKMLMLK